MSQARRLQLLINAPNQLDADVSGKRCLLLTCGPMHLRQHLHPAALRAKLELADHYNEYADLSKDFARRYGPLQPVANCMGASASPMAQLCSWPASCSSSSSTCSSAYASLGPDCVPNGAEQPKVYCYCCDYYHAHFGQADFYAPPAGEVGPAEELEQSCEDPLAGSQSESQSQSKSHSELESESQEAKSLSQQQQQQQREQEQGKPKPRSRQQVSSCHSPAFGGGGEQMSAIRQVEEMLKCK